MVYGCKERFEHRLLKRRNRRLMGASMLSRRKNGRLSRDSRVASSVISVNTQCSRHRLVTKSSKPSTSGNVRPRVPFSSVTDGRSLFHSSVPCSAIDALDGRCSRKKP